jgi:uncharacterized RDD family membrane protein YckC
MKVVSVKYGYVGFWKRVLANIVEILILCIPFVYSYRYLITLSSKTGSILPFVIYWIFYFSFFVFLTVKFGGTLGKLVLGLRIVDKNGEYLSIYRSFIRLFSYILNSIVYTLILNEAIISHVNTNEVYKYVTHDKGTYDSIKSFVGLIFLVDVIVIVSNNKKRAIHDFIADSYVVTKGFIPSTQNEDIEGHSIQIIRISKIPKFSTISTSISATGFIVALCTIIIVNNNFKTNSIYTNIGAASVLSALLFGCVGIILSSVLIFRKAENKNTSVVQLIINTIFVITIFLYSIFK